MFKSDVNPMFRSKFSEDIFNNKYRHDGCETWSKLSHALVEDVCGPKDDRELLSKDDRAALTKIIRDLLFIPGGRYLYYAGRPRKFYNNCLSGSTRVLTDEGYKRLDSFSEGKAIRVYSPVENEYLPATAHCHGYQQLYNITFAPIRGRSTKTWEIQATRDHTWFTTKGKTEHLEIGDVVLAADVSLKGDAKGFIHGLVFADGSVSQQHADGTYSHQLRLCGDKARHVTFLEMHGVSITYPQFADGDPVAYVKSDRDLKQLPVDESPEYVADFLEGWVDMDGHHSTVQQIHSIDKAAIEWFCEVSSLAGYIVSGEIRALTAPTNFAPDGRKPCYYVNFEYADNFSGFKVIGIEPAGVEKVYCPFEPKHNRIVIDYGMETGNCYLLRAEEDSREDWANLSWKAESCLMTGGGIGVDYSVYRQSQTVLGGTGGFASGPIPKMLMLNEQGRNVMQGGSRRSAIYASLLWLHGDIHKFLVAKNWHEMPVAGTKLTLADLKKSDFNFPCPLDMTNISVNYDTAWLLNYLQTGELDEVFLKNAEQACSTAEPGFSFNFFDKERETLRNACTEVCSEDDSDVCNLGSINLGRIESLEQLKDVVELATKFLVCGTLRAHLPYDKVAQVREKNRRLGLGLMGLHEWLLKRGYKYEVTPELHAWLTVYRGVSDDISKKFADQLGISRPVANRAVAPTGTIGILAGTTTGIEPMFAVALKRRYLKQGTRWHYQYVVDSVAQEMIDLYGLDPNDMESAIDLASDYERRIKFQADIQDYVDQSISSTINLPKWGSRYNNPDTVKKFARTLAEYAPRLRGFTCYPHEARGGQPLSSVPYSEAIDKLGEEFEESVETHDVCELTGHGGSCGV